MTLDHISLKSLKTVSRLLLPYPVWFFTTKPSYLSWSLSNSIDTESLFLENSQPVSGLLPSVGFFPPHFAHSTFLLAFSFCRDCDCISQGLNCPQVPEAICWQVWLAFMTLSPLVRIPVSLRNIAFSQRAWGISEGREGQGQLLNFIPRQFEKCLVSKEWSLVWYTATSYSCCFHLSWGDIWQEQPSANLGKQWLCLKLWSQQHPTLKAKPLR